MVLGDAVSKLETFVWIMSHISRSKTWSLFTLKASYLVKWSILTWSFLWWCQFSDWLKFVETRPSSLFNFRTAYWTIDLEMVSRKSFKQGNYFQLIIKQLLNSAVVGRRRIIPSKLDLQTSQPCSFNNCWILGLRILDNTMSRSHRLQPYWPEYTIQLWRFTHLRNNVLSNFRPLPEN